jgi:predicted Ser/Thr protein kinase
VEVFLGAGGMGEVYRCRDTRLARAVAVKILPAAEPAERDRRSRFEDEARALSSLSHPHIRALYDVGSIDGFDFLVMEYVEGQTLDSVLKKRALPVEQALRHGIQIADALSAAHRRGIAHADIKPANIMLTPGGVKLLDFGLATLWSDVHAPADPDSAATDTDANVVPGTTAYMAPERLEGAAADARADIFSCGVVLYEMLTGQKPFDAPSRARLITAILEHEPQRVSTHNPQVSPELDRTVMKCLAKEPELRWQTARDLASELAWIAQRAHAPASTTASGATAKFGRLAVAAFALVVVAALAVFAASRLSSDTPEGAGESVRFLVEPPIGSLISVNPGAFAVSPDGRTIAFTASSGGKRVLWVRSLDAYDARPLPGTDDAWAPFWRRDSRRVGFFAGEGIRSADPASGSVLTIAGLPPGTPRGATASWGDGQIVVASGDTLLRIPDSGGTPTAIAIADAPAHTRYSTPLFLPDGRRFLYFRNEGSPARNGVYVAGLDTQTPHRRVIDSDSQAQYVEPGYLLYVKGGTLLARRVDPATLDPLGEPTPFPETVSFFPSFNQAAFSASQGSVLAFRARVMASELRWFDRAGRLLAPVATAAPYLNPALSPDGTRVAVTRLDPAVGTPDIWVIDAAGGASQITSDPGIEDFPLWSPDGLRVLYNATRGDGRRELAAKPWTADASDPADVLVADDQNKFPFQWTKSVLLYGAAPPTGLLNARFFVRPFDSARDGRFDEADNAAPGIPTSEEPPRLEEGQPQLSPDGKWMAYVSDVTGSPQVFVRPFPTGPSHVLVSPGGGFEPKWRADGRELFYLAPDRTLMAVDVRAQNDTFSAAVPRPLFRTNLMGAYLGSPFLNTRVRNEYEVSADGQRFLLNEPVEGPSAYAVRILVNWIALLGTP